MIRGSRVKSSTRRSGVVVLRLRGRALVRWDNQHPDYDCGIFRPFLALEKLSDLSEVEIGHP
jgi:hypothetical protein